jgi:hypothetical protein
MGSKYIINNENEKEMNRNLKAEIFLSVIFSFNFISSIFLTPFFNWVVWSHFPLS